MLYVTPRCSSLSHLILSSILPLVSKNETGMLTKPLNGLKKSMKNEYCSFHNLSTVGHHSPSHPPAPTDRPRYAHRRPSSSPNHQNSFTYCHSRYKHHGHLCKRRHAINPSSTYSSFEVSHSHPHSHSHPKLSTAISPFPRCMNLKPSPKVPKIIRKRPVHPPPPPSLNLAK